MPSVLCLNDQGGSVMDCTVGITGTLRAQEHGHQPLVYENHGIDADTPGHTPLPRRSPPVRGPEATIYRWWNRETRLTGRLLKRTAFFMPDSVWTYFTITMWPLQKAPDSIKMPQTWYVNRQIAAD